MYSSDWMMASSSFFPSFEMLADAPFLHPDDLDDLFRDAALFDLGDVHGAAAERFGPVRQRFDDPADVHILQVAVFPHEIEDESPALLVAQSPQLGIVGLVGQIEGRNRRSIRPSSILPPEAIRSA